MNRLNQLIELLDWRCDPLPSPYQRDAWQEILSFPHEEALPALRAYETKLREIPAFCPHSYTRSFERRMEAKGIKTA